MIKQVSKIISCALLGFFVNVVSLIWTTLQKQDLVFGAWGCGVTYLNSFHGKLLSREHTQKGELQRNNRQVHVTVTQLDDTKKQRQ